MIPPSSCIVTAMMIIPFNTPWLLTARPTCFTHDIIYPMQSFGRNKYHPSQTTPIPHFTMAGDWTFQKFLGSMEASPSRTSNNTLLMLLRLMLQRNHWELREREESPLELELNLVRRILICWRRPTLYNLLMPQRMLLLHYKQPISNQFFS